LREIDRIQLFAALEQGIFANIRRSKTGGKGLEGVMAKEYVYFNPFAEAMQREGMAR